jgi:predicted AAA+ superfamily ATPase
MTVKTKPVVRILDGFKVDGTRVTDRCFELVYNLETNTRGSYVTVRENGSKTRIRVAHPDHFEIIEGESPVSDVVEFKTNTAKVAETKTVESDEEAMDRIQQRFAVLDEMSGACISGGIRAMIVSGPPGVGKSYGVEQQLEAASLFDRLSSKRVRYEIVKGAMTPIGLYCQLYKYSDSKNVLVFDDCDSVFQDDLALNILKAALDSGKKRKICWNSDSAMLRREGVPDSFEFKGSAIFITNLKFENLKSKKLQDHLEALQSRCHFLDLTIDTERDKMLRIKQVHRDTDGGLFAVYDFDNNEADQILDFMYLRKDRLRELSLRMALKIADLVKISPTNWRSLAESTCMRR